MVTKARKLGCSMVTVHHTGKSMTLGPDGIPTWRGIYDMATRLDKTLCLLPCQSSLDGYITFQVLEGKSRRGERINKTIQFNPFEKKWELFDESNTENRHEMVKELVELGLIAKYEDLKDILDRSASSAERYIKQSIESGILKENEWRERNQKAKNSYLSRQERIEKGREDVQNHFKVLVNEQGRGGRYLVERDNFSYQENSDF